MPGRYLNIKLLLPLAGLICVCAIAASAPTGAGPAAGKPQPSPQTVALESRFAQEVKPLLVQYCFNCHGNGKAKGQVGLDPFTDLVSVQGAAQTWNAVSDVLTHRVMPPEDKKQPSDAERKLITEWIGEALNHYDFSGPRDPGHVPIRRLNRSEYNNTIRDLLLIEDFRAADDFPADDTGYGFDTIADVLTVSPLHTEKYLAAAETALDKVFGSEEKHKRLAKVKKYDGAEMKSTSGQARGKTWVFNAAGEVFVEHEFARAGQYEVRINAAPEAVGPDKGKMELKVGDKVEKVFELAGKIRNDVRNYKHTVEVKATGPRRLAVGFTNPFKDPATGKERRLYVQSVEVESLVPDPPGFYSPSLKRIFFVMPSKDVSEESASRQIVRKFMYRAYRRSVSLDEVDRVLKLFKGARAEGDSFEQSIRYALSAVLVSPNFLYRIEPDAPAARNTDTVVRPLNDHELATRLSYFLWSSTPDDMLLALADAGRLKNAKELESQVRRMLADAKAKAFVQNFAGQWLELRNLEEVSPDSKKFPSFDESLKEAMRKEAELYFENIIKEDRSVLELLHSDYTFANGKLARHYGISGVFGEEFRRVSLKGTPRGGVLTMGGVLTVTAMPSRTSPVKRGKFILEQILGTPPPPPPPDTPALPEKEEDTTSKTFRQRLEKHRSDPACAICHIRMDPIGFSMENFDAIGAWRTMEDGSPIDNTGSLPDGTKLDGPESLRKLLLSRKDEFVYCLTEKLMTYGLGRGTEAYDRVTIKEISGSVAQAEYRFSSLITAIVQSDAFTRRRGKMPRETAKPSAPVVAAPGDNAVPTKK